MDLIYHILGCGAHTSSDGRRTAQRRAAVGGVHVSAPCAGAAQLDYYLSAVRGAVSGGRRTEQWRAAIGGAHVNAPCAGAAQLGVP